MNDNDKKKFQEIMMAAGEVYSREITKPLLKIYFSALSDLSIEQVSNSFMQHIKSPDQSGSFFPKPAEIIKRATGSTEQNKIAVNDRANMAWACILDAIAKIGPYGKLSLKDMQAMAAVKSIGGWTSLCMLSYEQLDWKKKDFINAYECYERTPIENMPKELPSLHDIENHKLDCAKTMKSLTNEIDKRFGKEEIIAIESDKSE